MEKIKILFVVSDLRRCGPTNQLFGIVSNLERNEFDFKIITLNKEPKNTEIELFLNNGINVTCINENKKNIFLQIRRLKREINLYQANIIHSSGIRANIIANLVKKKTKQIVTLRNNAYQEYPMQMNKIKSYIAIRLTELIIKRADYCVCCSYCLKNAYNDHGFKDVLAIQNGVDINKYNIHNYKQEEIFRKFLNLDSNKKVFIVSGLLNSRKNVLIIIKSFLYSIRKNDSYLILLGDGELKEEAMKLSNHCENILFEGNVNNVPEYLNIADYYISASKAEGLPNSVLEAGCMGLQLILSDIPEHKEIESGLDHSSIKYFNYNNVIELTDILTNCTSKMQLSQKIYNSNDFIENYSSAKMSKEYAFLYRKVI